jgi:uncharacterized damage-inducible protein DinB
MRMSEREREQLLVTPLPGYEPVVGRWLWIMEDARQRTKESLAGVTQAELDWTGAGWPDSIGTILYHIALIEMDWLYVEVLEQEIPPAGAALFPHPSRDAEGRLSAVRGLSLADYLHLLDTVRATFLAAFQGMSEAEFRRVRRLDAYDVTPEWVIYHMAQHEIEHHGDLMALRRLAAAHQESAENS